MRLIFVHGWSVTTTDTYGDMPDVLAKASAEHGFEIDIKHIHLGKYISFHDEVTMDDIARAMDQALRELPGNSREKIEAFSCITHSTGGPVVRSWIDRFYGKDGLKDLPLKHLVMLAPANHGSSLAALGKSRVGRIKAWFNGIEPGQRVLDWLSLGSNGQWDLNRNWTEYDYSGTDFYPYVLAGQGIDRKFYDFLNSYLIEKGSDGVIRVAGANLNYRYFVLKQDTKQEIRKKPLTYRLVPEENSGTVPEKTALRVYGEYSHSGKKMGIMRSICTDDTDAPVVKDIMRCLRVSCREDYSSCADELDRETAEAQENGSCFCMLVFNIRDEQGEFISEDDYDLYLLAGNKYKPDQLPGGFFVDRQMNKQTGRLVYYLDAGKMQHIKDDKFGIRVVARPSKGFSYYRAGEYRSDGLDVRDILAPNQVTYVDIVLNRFVDENVFRFGEVKDKPESFKKIKPSNRSVNNK